MPSHTILSIRTCSLGTPLLFLKKIRVLVIHCKWSEIQKNSADIDDVDDHYSTGGGPYSVPIKIGLRKNVLLLSVIGSLPPF